MLTFKQVLGKAEVKGLLEAVAGKSCKEMLRLITVDHKAKKCGFENLYTFQHLTFQEYLAAYHVFKLGEEEQMHVLKQHGRKQHMEVVWKFYCGLVNFQNKTSKFEEILHLAFRENISQFDHLSVAQCAFESQQSIACDSLVLHVLQQSHGTLSLSDYYLTPLDFTALGYILQKTTITRYVKKAALFGLIPVEMCMPADLTIHMFNCKFDEEGIQALLKEADNLKLLSIKNRYYNECSCTERTFNLSNPNDVMTETFDMPNSHVPYDGSNKEEFLIVKLVSLPIHDGAEEREITISLQCLSASIIKSFLKSFDMWPLFLHSISRQVNVDLKKNDLQVADIKIIAEGLKELMCCTSLNLRDCNISDSGCQAIAEGLACCHVLTELLLPKNRISDSGATELSKVLPSCIELEFLDVSSNCISGAGMTAIVESCSSLKTLNGSNNAIDDTGSTCFTKGLKNLANIKEVFLTNNKIGDKVALSIAEAIKNSDLNLIDLGHNMIGAGGARAIVQYCSTLRTLRLGWNSLNAESVKDFAEGLQHCKNLRELFLPGNDIEVDGAKALAHGLKHLNSLQVLRLANTELHNDGVRALCEDYFLLCRSMETLDLECCDIQDDGAKHLAEGLKHCNTLQLLWLNHNGIGSDGAEALGKGLHAWKSLHTLGLEGNSIGDDGIKALGIGLQHCNVLQKLWLKNNRFSVDGVQALAKGLKHSIDSREKKLTINGMGPKGFTIAFCEILYNGMIELWV